MESQKHAMSLTVYHLFSIKNALKKLKKLNQF